MFKSVLGDADAFFRLFCRLLAFRLDLPDETEMFWQIPMPNPIRATECVAQYILQKSDTPILLAMDEVETVFDTDFRTDFFGMLRAWHSNRAIDPLWKKLSLVLVTSTEPYFFIENLNQSPFNVGEVAALRPFTAVQVNELNQRHQAPFDAAQTDVLHALLNGHPFLTRRACYLVANGRFDPTTLLTTAADLDGPFGDHLRRLLLLLHEQPELAASLRQIINTRRCDDKLALFRLRGAGLVRESGGNIVPANQLYAACFADYFDE
jgi:hypothetical protein